MKPTLPTLYQEETNGYIQVEKRKQRDQVKVKKIKELEEKNLLRQKEEFENNKLNENHPNAQGRVKGKYLNYN